MLVLYKFNKEWKGRESEGKVQVTERASQGDGGPEADKEVPQGVSSDCMYKLRQKVWVDR